MHQAVRREATKKEVPDATETSQVDLALGQSQVIVRFYLAGQDFESRQMKRRASFMRSYFFARDVQSWCGNVALLLLYALSWKGEIMDGNGRPDFQNKKSSEELHQLVQMMRTLIELMQNQEARSGIPELLTIEDVAGITKFHKRSISRKLLEGDIPEPIQVGRSPRWPSTVIINWIAKGCPKNFS